MLREKFRLTLKILNRSVHVIHLHWSCTLVQILPPPLRKKKVFIKKIVEINILQAIMITYTNLLCNKTIIFINENDNATTHTHVARVTF